MRQQRRKKIPVSHQDDDSVSRHGNPRSALFQQQSSPTRIVRPFVANPLGSPEERARIRSNLQLMMNATEFAIQRNYSSVLIETNHNLAKNDRRLKGLKFSKFVEGESVAWSVFNLPKNMETDSFAVTLVVVATYHSAVPLISRPDRIDFARFQKWTKCV